MIGDGGKMDEEDTTAAFDIPIFTEEFLDHNKSMLPFFLLPIGNALLLV